MFTSTKTLASYEKIKKPSFNFTSWNNLIAKWQTGPLFLALHSAVPLKFQTEYEIPVLRVAVNYSDFLYHFDKSILYNTVDFSFLSVTCAKNYTVTSFSLGTRWCDASRVLVSGSLQNPAKVFPGTTLHFAPQSLIVEI